MYAAELATDVSLSGLKAAVSRAGLTNPHSNGPNRSYMRIKEICVKNAKNDALI
jgi:hypothetical protein